LVKNCEETHTGHLATRIFAQLKKKKRKREGGTNGHNLVTFHITKFYKNRSSDSGVVTCGRHAGGHGETNVQFANFAANVPEM
jgi:hypothetical protein